jgi:WXG100 family type VII secretion target
MTVYEVGPAQMEFVRGEMDAVTKHVQRTLADLNDEAEQNLADWSGDAQAVYQRVQNQWNQAVQQMSIQVAAAAAALGATNEYYINGEKYGMSLWEQ